MSIPLSKVIVVAEEAAMALAFGRGPGVRQEDIWIDDLTEQEAKLLLKLRGHEHKWKDFVDACVPAPFNNVLID